MTEDEAKNKWCPFVRVAMTNDRVATNRGHILKGGDSINMCCIGSECMAWRTMNHGPKAPECPDGIYESGYCGLAGKP